MVGKGTSEETVITGKREHTVPYLFASGLLERSGTASFNYSYPSFVMPLVDAFIITFPVA